MNALLLIGSPKARRSTSEAVGTYLLDRLREQGVETDLLRILSMLRAEDGEERLRTAVRAADVVILASPLYVDSLPAPVIRAMEILAAAAVASAKQVPAATQRLTAIINNGFPEASQNGTALAICRRFAAEVGMEWVGGLALGGGGAIDGKPLDKAGSMARNVRRALDLTGEALAAGQHIPGEAVDLMAKPLMPTWLYTGIGSIGWWFQMRKRGTGGKLRDRPYEP